MAAPNKSVADAAFVQAAMRWTYSLGIAIAIVIIAIRAADGSAGEAARLTAAGFGLWAALLVAAAGWWRYQRWRDDRWWGRR